MCGEDYNGDGLANTDDCVGDPQCWDTNKNMQCDLDTEDYNGDGKCDPADCTGSPTCWDHNQNRYPDPEEDINGDGVVNTDDCLGDAWCWDVNGNKERDLDIEDTNGDGVVNTKDCTGKSVPIHSSQIEVKRRVAPKFPKAVKAMGNKGDVKCTVHFFNDASGVPTKVVIMDGCPKAYHESILEAAYRWRFYPYKNEQGEKVESNFRLGLTFRLK